MIPIQANVDGYYGRPATVFGAYDDDTGILVIAAASDALPRRDGCLLIETDPRKDRDALFGYADLRDAILAYHKLRDSRATDESSARLHFAEKARRADPGSAIEIDGVDVNGPQYRIAPEATNMQIATLALCLQVLRHEVSEDVVGMTRLMVDVMAGRAVTI